MSDHANLSPSKRHRWALCPGSVREEAKYPDERSGAAAADGTHSHTLLEYCVKSNLADPMAYVRCVIDDHEGRFEVDVERAQRVKVAIDYISQRVAEAGGLALVIPETRVDPWGLTGRTDLSGTVDVQIRAPGFLEVIDYKDGMGVVDAEDNLQLEQYAIGILAEEGLPITALASEYTWPMIRMTIIQPKLAFKGLTPISTWEVPTEQVLHRVKSLIAEAQATDAPDAQLVPGEKQCKFCRAKGGCSALASKTMEDVGMLFKPTDIAPLDLAQQSANKDPATMDDHQIRQIMEAAPLMRQLLEAVEKEALRRLEGGQFIPGLKLVHGRGSRAWSLPEEEMAEKLIKMGIPKGAVYETKLISPAKAEKLTWEKRDGTRMQLTERQLKRMEQEYVQKSLGKLTVVSEADSRPAVKTDASNLFENLTATTIETLPPWLS